MRTTLFLSSLLLLASACRDSELTVAQPFSRTSTAATTAPATAGPEAPIAASVESAKTDDLYADPWAGPVTPSTTTTTTTATTAASTEPVPAATTSAQGPVWIETTCEEASVESQLAAIKQENASARDVEIGKAGVIVDKGNRQQLTAWDTDSNCHVDVTAPKDVDTVSIARTVLSQLPGRG